MFLLSQICEKCKGFYIRSNTSLLEIAGKLNPAALRPLEAAPLKVTGNFQMTAHSQVIYEGTTILHLLSEGINASGSPARIMAEHLSAALGPEDFLFEEIRFNLSTPALVCSHGHRLREIVKGATE